MRNGSATAVERGPGPAVESRPTWQSAKSDATRRHILETTVECLAEMPCSAVSTSVICERSGVSRGGVQYHFPTRTELLQAAIEHVHRRRLDAYGRDLRSASGDVEVTDHIIDTHWRNLTAPEFRAYQELVVAARSDPELKQALTAHYPDFIREWLQISFRRFGWRYSTPEVMRVGNIAHYLMDGMAYGQLAGQLREDEVHDLLDYAKQLMRQGVAQSRRADDQAGAEPAGDPV